MKFNNILTALVFTLALIGCGDAKSFKSPPKVDEDYIETVEEANAKGAGIVDTTPDTDSLEIMTDDSWTDDGVYSDEYKDGVIVQEWTVGIVPESKYRLQGSIVIGTKTDESILQGVVVNGGDCAVTLNKSIPQYMNPTDEVIADVSCSASYIEDVTILSDMGEITIPLK